MVQPVPQLRLASLFGLALWLGGRPASAAEPAPPPPVEAVPAQPAPAQPAPAQPAPAVPAACYPSCREGFTCYEGKCVSLCNPPCPEGVECVAGRRCEPPLPGGSGQAGKVYEPPPPPTKSFEQRSHTLAAFHLGFPGAVDIDGQETDLGSTLGFNIRGDTPIAGYVLIGPMLQFGAWSPDTTPEPSSNYYVDLDLVLRLRAPLTTSKFNYQVWLGMPVGLTVDVLGNEVLDKSAVGIGWNIGVLFGGAVHFTPKIGMFTELGWLQHKVAHDGEVGPDLDFALRQFCLNIGLIVRN
jgi:hypothetical protein